ncbi:hypothetical protein PCASD_16630 [Puccinia coronata f. sp. avenae]|uniref:Uncharacterized protein n=1 Tax=Puccinia coronata f. sp. avenae TaxID=200324 RepID=A0A2N5T3N4_9BASI|nr:hypothetical protein PCASD_16630 [Puccinia coronata f. sp. avenae]
MTIFADSGDGLQTFDHVEGTSLLSPDEIKRLKEESKSLSGIQYLHAVEEARKSLQKMLHENDFTTIALKTAPSEITEVLKAYKHKVAVIWTGPVDKLPNSENWATKYNYAIAPEASDRLLEIGVPIVAVSPSVGNAKMNAIVDQHFMPQIFDFKLNSRKAFLPTDDSFPGFHDLATIPPDVQAKFSNYIIPLADSLTERMIADAGKQKAILDYKEKILNKKADRGAKYQKAISDIAG